MQSYHSQGNLNCLLVREGKGELGIGSVLLGVLPMMEGVSWNHPRRDTLGMWFHSQLTVIRVGATTNGVMLPSLRPSHLLGQPGDLLQLKADTGRVISFQSSQLPGPAGCVVGAAGSACPPGRLDLQCHQGALPGPGTGTPHSVRQQTQSLAACVTLASPGSRWSCA